MDWKTIRGKKMNKINAEMRRKIDFKSIHKRILCIVHAEMKGVIEEEPVVFPNTVAKWTIV